MNDATSSRRPDRPTPADNDPRHIAIMEGWVHRIVAKVGQEVADGICEEVGRIFLGAKNANYDNARRMDAIEEAIASLKKTLAAKKKQRASYRREA